MPNLDRTPVHDLRTALVDAARRYPPELVDAELGDVDRIVFHATKTLELAGVGGAVADLGGGVGMMSLACALVGLQSTLIDDFGDDVNATFGDRVLDQHRAAGVTITSRDIIGDGIDEAPASLDVITTFDSMEHWHHSPKRLFHQCVEALKPGGHLFIGVPNCVNLRKRIMVPMGRGKWSTMEHWYEAPEFRGHVREPDVDDLRYIARDLKLEVVEIFGRNWLGYRSTRPWVRKVVPYVDRMITPFPGLCSDIYLVARKPR